MLDCPQIGTGGSHCRHYDEETPCCWCNTFAKQEANNALPIGLNGGDDA